MRQLLQFLPILTSIIIAIMYYVLKLQIKKTFDFSLEKEKKILELKYNTLYDEKQKRNSKLEFLHDKYLELNEFLKKNHKTEKNIIQIEIFYSLILHNKLRLVSFCSDELVFIINNLFRFSDGKEYIEHFKININEFNLIKTEFENKLRNERNN